MIFNQIFRKILRSKATTPTKYILTLFSAGFLALSVVEGLIWILALLLFTSCSTSRHIQTQVVEKVSKDTIYLSNVQYDSIYILQDKYTDRCKDTLLIKETNIEYRYKLLKDTIRIVQRDSIPYEVRIVEIKEVKYTPPWIQYLAWAGGLTILLLICCVIWKFARE